MIAWFSANAFVATVAPVKDGGIPDLAELKLVFKEGGAFEFYNTYTMLLDRLHAQDGDAVEHLEDLPVYLNEGGNAGGPSLAQGAPMTDPPDDLPPTYDDVAAEEAPRGRARTRRT